jgi:RNA polymerase sigma factor (sigma-70 family)
MVSDYQVSLTSHRNRLITLNVDLVKEVAVTVERKSILPMDELVAVGNLALVEAAERFDSTRNDNFRSWAYVRVNGAMIDAVRSWTFGRQKNKVSEEQPLSLDLLEEEGQSGGLSTIDNHDAFYIREALRRIPRQYARLILQCIFVGVEMTEIGKSDGVTVSAISQKCRLARGIMQAQMDVP